MEEQLFKQFTEDASALLSFLTRDEPLHPSHVRITASAILRKWLNEGLINMLAKESGIRFTFKTHDTKDIVSAIDNNKSINFFMTAGVYLNGYPIRGIYASDSPALLDNKPLIPIDQIKFNDFKPSQLLKEQRIFYHGEWFNSRQIIQFVANKYGGVHFDTSRNHVWETKIEQASKYLIAGNPDNSDQMKIIEPYSEAHQILLVLPKEKGNIWNCLDIELLALAQAFINIHLDGKPFVVYEN